MSQHDVTGSTQHVAPNNLAICWVKIMRSVGRGLIVKSNRFFFSRTTSSMTANNWLAYSYTTFIIYSRNAVDGTPVQHGDIVGFKYPYGSQSAWLYRSSSYFYSNNCSSTSKTSCAAANTATGFQIFKQL